MAKAKSASNAPKLDTPTRARSVNLNRSVNTARNNSRLCNTSRDSRSAWREYSSKFGER